MKNLTINVGDYVRTPLGITKYLGKYNMAGNTDDWYEFDKLDENLWFGDIANVIYKNQFDEVVLKSSPNIIDLIEEFDYIKIEDWGGIKFWRVVKAPYGKLMFEDDGWNELEDFEDEEIAEIITHEQMESIAYKVGE